jgi:hypothetical protein
VFVRRRSEKESLRDVQSASEKQETQHALHQHFGEIDRADQLVFAPARRRDADFVEDNDYERERQRDRHDADRHRPFQVPVIQV